MDPREPLVLYGRDSLRSVELEALLEDAFDRPLPDDLAGNPSLDALISVLEDGERRTRDRDADHARAGVGGARAGLDVALAHTCHCRPGPLPSSSSRPPLRWTKASFDVMLRSRPCGWPLTWWTV